MGRLAVLEVDCSSQESRCGDNLGDLVGSSAFPNLRRLALTGEYIDFDPLALARSPHFPRLQSLAMPGGGGEVSTDFHAALEAFADSPHFPYLRELLLGPGPLRQSSLNGLLALVRSPGLPRLEVIDLRRDENVLRRAEDSDETDDDERPNCLAFARELATIPEAARLRKLLLAHYRLRDGGVEALASSPYLAGLTSLNLANTQIADAGAAALASSRHLTGLTTLNLTANQIGAAGMLALVNAPHLVNLTSLKLWGNGMDDEARDWLLAGRWSAPGIYGRWEYGCPRPEGGTLELRQTKLSDEAGRALAGSPRLARFTTLNLQGNQIGYKAALALAESPHLAHLSSLDLGLNQIDVAGVLALATSGHLPRLTSLNLEKNGLTPQAAKKIEPIAAYAIRVGSYQIPSAYLNLQ
jgi:hypothetical protein